MTPSLGWYLALAALLFAVGGVGLLVRRDPLILVMCVEMMWNAANLALAAAARHWGVAAGQVLVFLVVTVAAADVAIGLALTVLVARRRAAAAGVLDVDELSTLRG